MQPNMEGEILGNHQFDWRGFRFAVIGVVIVVGALGSLEYFEPRISSLTTRDTAIPNPTESLASRATTVDVPPMPDPSLMHVQPDDFSVVTPAEVVSVATSSRVIDTVTIEQAVPKEGRFIVADLSTMKLHLYEGGTTTVTYPILSKGRPGTPWDTPSGLYSIRLKEENHLSSIGKVYMPFSMQFMGNYYIHGWPYYPDGTPVASTYSGGCIRLSTADAEQVYAFAEGKKGTTDGTGIFVYDPKHEARTLSPLPMSSDGLPPIRAQSYLVADIDTGSVYVESGAGVVEPISSTTALMTALVANEIISFDKKIPVERSAIILPGTEATSSEPHPLVNEFFAIGDLLYPLLMQSNATVADYIAGYYGPHGFVSWMNATARSLNMMSTTFADADDHSRQNAATTDDVYRLLSYLADKKSFILNIAQTKEKSIVAESGEVYQITNMNSASTSVSALAPFPAATTSDSMLGATAQVASLKVGKDTRRVAVVVLQSDTPQEDADALVSWWKAAVKQGLDTKNAACAQCSAKRVYRVIGK